MPNVRKASAADLSQMLTDSVCMHKNKPYYVQRVDGDYTARCINLLTGRQEYVHGIDETTFAAPTQRIGFVNVKGNVVYGTRVPLRRYKVGLTSENVQWKTLHDFVAYKPQVNKVLDYLNDMQRLEMADALMCRYPSIEEAWRRIIEDGASCVAFDKQFAIARNGSIFYKEAHVGSVLRAPRGIEDIEFKAEYIYLNTLLGKNYEAALPNA